LEADIHQGDGYVSFVRFSEVSRRELSVTNKTPGRCRGFEFVIWTPSETCSWDYAKRLEFSIGSTPLVETVRAIACTFRLRSSSYGGTLPTLATVLLEGS
jgi:hypothetical protein